MIEPAWGVETNITVPQVQIPPIWHSRQAKNPSKVFERKQILINPGVSHCLNQASILEIQYNIINNSICIVYIL
jgi:hypothetical protein